MGYDLSAFLGKTSILRTWKEMLPSAVLCELDGDLGLVPVTGKLDSELRNHPGKDEATRLDVAQSYPASPSTSQMESARRWGLEASKRTVIAYVRVGEWGDNGWDEASLWSDGKEMISQLSLQAVLDYFRYQAGFNLGNKPIELLLERHGGEDAAEKWAAAATVSERR